MGLIDEIAVIDADIEDAMHRFMDNTALYERMLKKLPEVIAKAPVKEFLDSGDMETVLSNAHTIKGVVGNLSLMKLHEYYTQIVEYCREEDYKSAESTLDKTLVLQEKVLDCIKKYS